MFTTSSDFKTGMAEPSRQLTARGLITYTDGTQALTSAEISKIQITENAGEHLPLGGVSASTLTLSLDNRSGEWNAGGSILGSHSLDGATVKLEVGVYYDSAYQYSNLGIFVLEDVVGQEQETLITLKGADYLANAAGITWTDGLTYPKTVIQILTEACSQSGITLKSTTFTNSTQSIATKPVWDENTTCRDVIGFIACLGAGFARIARDGELEIISFDDTSDYSVTTARYKTFTKQGIEFGAFNSLSVYPYGAPNGYGATRIADDLGIGDNELNSIAVQDNPILEYDSDAFDDLIAGMLTSLSGLSFVGGSIDWQGDPSLTAGDVVTVTDLESDDFKVLILNQSITLDAGFSMTSGNNLHSNTMGNAKTGWMRVFTPTGKLNATMLDGDINIRAGNQLNLLAGADIKVKSGANVDIEAGGKINLSATGDLTVGTDTLAELLTVTGSVQTTIWYQDAEPTATATGDIWYDTDASPVTIKRWNGSSWVDITTTALSQALTAAGDAQATADGKIKVWAQPSDPTASATGDLWIDTDDNNKIYRWSGSAWTLYKVAAGYVATSYITIANDIDIASGGNLNIKSGADVNVASGGKINIASADGIVLSSGSGLDSALGGKLGTNDPAAGVQTSKITIDSDSIDIASGGNLNLLSGGAINIKNLSGTDNVINMDSTGLTLSSTGQLKLQSTDSIIIGGSPFGVGGTNLLPATSASYTNKAFSNQYFVSLGTYSLATLRLSPGDTVTFQAYLKLTSAPTAGMRIFIMENNGSENIVFNYGNTIPASSEGYSSKTFTINAATVSFVLIFGTADSVNITSTEQYKWLKLEKGSVATDWSPSPQDTVDALDGLDGRLGDVETRVQVFYQASKPTYTAVGDIWYDTDSNPLEVWKCTNVSTQAHSAFTDPVLTRALAAQTTANSKITTFVGSSTPTALAAGDLWMDTGNKNIWKRATVAGTGGWVQYLTAAGYLITTGITIDGTDLTVKATGNLNLAADANLNVQSGGNLNVLNGGDIEISSGGDINVASGGKINVAALSDITVNSGGFLSAVASSIDLSANTSINLAVSGVRPGGCNICIGTDLPTRATYQGQALYTYGDISEYYGKQVIVSFDYEATGVTPGSSFVLATYNTWQSLTNSVPLTQSNQSGRVIGVPVTLASQHSSTVYLGWSGTISGSITIKNLMLNEGNVPMPWELSEYDKAGPNNYCPGFYQGNYSLINGGSFGQEGTLVCPPVASGVETANPLKWTPCKPGRYRLAWTSSPSGGRVCVKIRDASNADIESGATGGTYNNYYKGWYFDDVGGLITLPSNTASVAFMFIGLNVQRTFTKCQFTRGDKVWDWQPYNPDPASGVKTSYIDIASDHIDISSGGSVNISAGSDFNVRAGKQNKAIGISNNEANGYMLWAGSDNPTNAPFRVTMDGELTASSIGGNLIIPVANGGTGYNRQTIHRGTDYPSSGFGQDGDLFIFHNGQANSSWSAQTLAYGAAGQNTHFGVYRNWNQVPTSGFYRFGNGVGSSVYDWGAYAYFTAPAAVNSLTFTFNTAKYFNSTWYGYSGTTTYKVALVKASNMAAILASTTCYATQNQNTQTVTLTTASNLTQGDTYYLAVFYDGSDEKTNAGIVGSITMQGKASSSRTFDLLLKSAGQWWALFGNG